MADHPDIPTARKRRAYLLITVICAFATVLFAGLAAFSTPRLPWLAAGICFLSATSLWIGNLRALARRECGRG